LTASPTNAEAPRAFGLTFNVDRPARSVSGRAKNSLTTTVACAGERPPTSTLPPIVTPAGIVEGRGGGGTGVVVVVVVVVVVTVVPGRVLVVVPVVPVPVVPVPVVPVSATAAGVAASSSALSSPAAPHAPRDAAARPPRLTIPV
jgi:hypothetical protein